VKDRFKHAALVLTGFMWLSAVQAQGSLASCTKHATTNTVTEKTKVVSAFMPKQARAGKHGVPRI
jgi:hypothetical protein